MVTILYDEAKPLVKIIAAHKLRHEPNKQRMDGDFDRYEKNDYLISLPSIYNQYDLFLSPSSFVL